MKKRNTIKFMIFGILLAVSLAGCSALKPAEPTEVANTAPVIDPSIVSVTGVVVPETYASLSTAAQGKVEEVLVKEGQSVNEGQALLVLGDRAQVEAALTAAQLELANAQQSYDEFTRNANMSHAADWQAYNDAQTARIAAEKAWQDLKDDNIDDRITDREVDVKARQDDLDTAQEDFDKYKDLDKENATRKRAEDDLETAQKAYDKARWDLEEAKLERETAQAALDSALAVEAEAKRQFELTLNAPDAEQLALLEARLNNAKAQVKAAQDNLDKLSLLAPFAGTVADLMIKPGEWASSGQRVLVLADLTSLRVETTDLNEVDVAKINLGDTVRITFDALPDVTIMGTVGQIAPKASPGSGVNYTVVIDLNEKPELMRWGMTAYVDFEPGN